MENFDSIIGNEYTDYDQKILTWLAGFHAFLNALNFLSVTPETRANALMIIEAMHSDLDRAAKKIIKP
jgi:hypothetical protein